MDSLHKEPVTWKTFLCHNIIMKISKQRHITHSCQPRTHNSTSNLLPKPCNPPEPHKQGRSWQVENWIKLPSPQRHNFDMENYTIIEYTVWYHNNTISYQNSKDKTSCFAYECATLHYEIQAIMDWKINFTLRKCSWNKIMRNHNFHFRISE